MRVRTGHGPDDWSVNEPLAPYRSNSVASSQSIAVRTLAEVVPILSQNGNTLVKSPTERPRSINPSTTALRERLLCLFVYRRRNRYATVSNVCARTPGHKGAHASAERLAINAAGRRSH